MASQKYEPLESHLSTVRASKWRVEFSEIEKILCAPLPASARRHRAWWSNNGSNNVMTKAWKAAGWIAEQVDMENQVLVFRRIGDGGGKTIPEESQPPAAGEGAAAAGEAKKFDFAFGRLKGTVTWTGDLTEPTGEIWDAEQGIL